MGKAPEIPEPKSQSMPANVTPLSARPGVTQTMPRQTFAPRRESLGTALTGAGQNTGRYDPRMAMDLLRRGGGAA